ncbi:hypothetical protein BM477_05050 [Boudabousia marimammalium]|uniref:Peptidase M13 n=2 Tax=Boudabousia marimammalium TaxID=156892 RepID=A0A1Q5PP97_9ACTO|nr:hypothetical protein BM477_05050 [Boudabousia marimammalium]
MINPNSPLLDGRDETVRPQDDLYRAVNGGWINSFTIPSDRPWHGSFLELRDNAEEATREIIEDCADGKITGPDAQRIAHLYNAFMDEAKVEAEGVGPLVPWFERVRSANSHEALARLMGDEMAQGTSGLFSIYVTIDPNDPSRYVVAWGQGGISLPDRSYYLEDNYAELREAYVAHMERLLTLATAVPAVEAAEAAVTLMKLETELAKLHWDRVESRDADKTNNPMTWEQLQALAPEFQWNAWLEGMAPAADSFANLIISQPSFAEGAARLWQETDVHTWQLWLLWKITQAGASKVNAEVVEENFSFWGRILTGTQELRARWKRGVSLVEDALGEAVGRIYVDRHFPAENKAQVQKLVDNLIAAYRSSIQNLDWMTEETKLRALEKLDAFVPKIGYPTQWKDYSSMELSGTDLVSLDRQTARFEAATELGKIGGPILTYEWHMTPQTVNAYYNPVANEIVFPAAILQPPFFSADAPDAVNYAGIGAVIGHEIGHGFDDQGSKFDGTGAMNDWWTAADRAEFEKRTAQLIAQYNEFSPLQLGDSEKYRVNGALTIGENIGDLGGLSIAWKAWLLALQEQGVSSVEEAPAVDGIPAAQAFFYSWARIWRSKAHNEFAIQLLQIDPHSPNEFRANGIVRNLDAFMSAFEVKAGDGLWLAPAERVTIW